MNRRNFVGSLFALGGVYKKAQHFAPGKPVVGSGEVVTPIDKMPVLVPDIRIDGSQLRIVLNRANITSTIHDH